MATTILKDLYSPYFKLGAACERISDRNPNNEIGNPDKEALLAAQFSSITCANELKPAYNMGYSSPDATETYLPFVINPAARELLDWAKSKGVSMRGHVLVWHSQCPKEAFCKGYKPITIPTDPEKLKENPHLKHFEKLDPVCFVDRTTMLKRLESYITSLMEYMYANGYAQTLYGWDVVNEAIELEDKTPTGLRNTYWYQVIGEDFMYYAFLYARNAVNEMSVKYAAAYGIDPTDEASLKTIQPALFYNDYNEMDPAKKDAIIAALTRKTDEHGSIVSEGLIDGIGMQGHISDTNDIDQYMQALRDYDALVSQVHITELDVKCTCTNVNAEYYQAVFYKKFFSSLVEAVKSGIKLTSVTLWGLTDDNSWIRDANPLLFHGDLTPKRSFDALVSVFTGEDLGEPEVIHYDLSDRHYDFENMESAPMTPPGSNVPLPENAPESFGFKMVGWGRMEISDKHFCTGSKSLALEKRFGSWSFIGYDLSDFIGQTITVSATLMSPAKSISLKLDSQKEAPEMQTFATASDKWTQASCTIKIPGDAHSCTLLFVPNDDTPEVNNPIYIDALQISLLGLSEGFEDEKNIASIRGAGHLPFLYVTDKEFFVPAAKEVLPVIPSGSSDEAVLPCNPSGHSLCVTRQEKDATVKFNISQFIGRKVKIAARIKTADTEIRMGMNLVPALELVKVPSANEWTLLTAEYEIPADQNSAEFYIETNGNKDMFIDDIFVRLA